MRQLVDLCEKFLANWHLISKDLAPIDKSSGYRMMFMSYNLRQNKNDRFLE